MSWKRAGIGLAIAAALVGCNNNDNNKGNNNIDTHRYQNDLNDNGDGTTRDRFNNDMNRTRDNVHNDMNRGRNTIDRDYNDRHGDHYNLSKKAANRIESEVQGIDGAYVVMTDNNAYVAANLDTNNSNGRTAGELTDSVKKHIKNIVQAEEPSVDRVYVSTNPDFANLMSRYSNDVDNGRPVGGMFTEIGNMIKRVFPQNK
ncbi:YhcN/YlaJ family sporulation lipoprotein [Aciduricibacillus chroicocephali]|uniref:YhcN/YlaJ family sporulation lipoprotein n=1 Tax=Aciduricibacillus chroicocephali TaxID=3054939 RepID=A0ABY9L0Z5_9BACI|nr:YhcN/YlaJ family sporulation lipoprotein [Bacillaceae bacterium 44XB]